MKINILSSTKQILKSDNVKHIIVPTKNGEIGIYPGHVPLIVALDIGQMRILNDNEEVNIAISGGFLTVRNDEIEILCDDAIMKEELVKAEIEKAEKDAEEKLASTLPETELIQLEKQLRFEKFKRKLIEN